MWTGRLARPSLFFVLAVPVAGAYMRHMPGSYGQFCPVAKASEIFAELIAGAHSFNDIHRGVPLISRAVLVARLRELEHHGVIEHRPRADGKGHEYCLTPAGEGLRTVTAALGQWGMTYTRDRIKRSDLDPALLVWGLRRKPPGESPLASVISGSWTRLHSESALPLKADSTRAQHRSADQTDDVQEPTGDRLPFIPWQRTAVQTIPGNPVAPWLIAKRGPAGVAGMTPPAGGRRWLEEILSGSVTDAEQIALRERRSVRHVNMTISLAFLAEPPVK
jgi:DNA-binding HxlR family transcriptional regulator